MTSLFIAMVGILLLQLSVHCQNENFNWVQNMDGKRIPEIVGQNVVVYQLLATDNGSPNGIEYGFNSKITIDADNTMDQIGNRFQIFPNGTVSTINAEFDYEIPAQREIIVHIIARRIADRTVFIKRSSTILITNQNDESPVFQNDSLTASIAENTIVPALGLKIKDNIYVQDPDGILNNNLSFVEAYVQECQIGDIIEDCTDKFALRNTRYNSKSYMGGFYVLKELDFERGSTITVQLQATDGLHPVNTDIVVTIVDVQDSGPEWTIFSNRFIHNDGTPANQFMGLVMANDTDTVDVRQIFYVLLPGMVDKYDVRHYFEIDNRTGIIRNKVVLDLESGPPFNRLNTIWPLTIRACEIIEEDPTQNIFVVGTSLINECILGTTIVDILDLNDNAPKFRTDKYTYYLSEDAQKGEYLTDPRIFISDMDTWVAGGSTRWVYNLTIGVHPYRNPDWRPGLALTYVFGILYVTVESGYTPYELYNKFTVKFSSPSEEFAVIGSNRNPTIRVEHPELIDYEKGPRTYELFLTAVDVNNKALRSTATVVIHIIDVNDNVPAFKFPIGTNRYEKYIPENAAGGTNVIRVEATDLDSGIFGTEGIRYSLQGWSEHTKLFHIDAKSGQVWVENCDTPGEKPCLDHETEPNIYTFFVDAIDTNGDTVNGRSESAELVIHITDVNDNSPKCLKLYTVNIEEGQNKTNPDLFVEANDPDNGGQVQLEYSILYQPLGDFWQLENVNNKAHITATKTIAYGDAQLDGLFALEILVTDGFNEATCSVNITVQDINDNIPKFLPPFYEISISEATLGDVFVINVTAFDADDPTSPNGQIYYQIINGALGKFLFKTTTENFGQIYTTVDATFDVSLKNRYNLTVAAADRGTPPQVGYTTVIINILGANNKLPAFRPDRQQFSVYDNEPVGNTVYTLVAHDPDADAKLEIEFKEPIIAYSEGTAVNGNFYPFVDLFRVNRTTGGVIVNKPLNSERVSMMTYTILVTDVTPNELQTGTGTLLIYIRDYNTVPPRFEDLQPNVTIPEEPAEGSFITNIIAVDDGSIKWYKIIEQADDLFVIGSTSGVVLFKANQRVDYDDVRRTNSSYFIVQVSDSGNPPLYAKARVDVYFTNINDNYPQFVSASRIPKETYYSDIHENSPDGTSVVKVYAIDGDRPDEKGYADLRFRMEDDRFTVDPITGEVTVRLQNGTVLDRERTPEISVPIWAYDTPNGPETVRKERVASISIQLLDVNDNPSEFSKNVYHVTIYETIVEDTNILQLFTSDIDSGINAIPFFYKVPKVGNDTDDNNFGVREETGHIYTTQSLLSKTHMFHFQVIAIDELGNGPFNRTADIYVTVKEASNNGPRFKKPAMDNMTINVLEEQYLGMLVFNVKAVDFDSGKNGVIDYSFVHEGSDTNRTGAFRINRVTGVITAEMVYDRETVDRYNLLLKATDRGITRLATTRFLTVIVLDVNDNKPTFPVNEIEFRVSENQIRGSNIGKVEASDLDVNPVIVYQIISGNEDGVFTLESTATGGYLTLARTLDREINDIYYLDILATNDEADYTVIRNRRRRAIDPSIITVKVLVGDINDLAPVFLQEPYYGCVSTRSSLMTSILAVQAIDRDAVGTGIVRYMITGGNVENDISLFTISEKFGYISNQVLMKDYVDRTFTVTVNARDGENIASSESSNTTAKIFVTQPGKEAKLLITQNTAEVRLYQTQIQRIIEKTNDVDYVCITDIQDHVVDSAGSLTTLWSDVYISAVKDGHILPSTTLVNIVNMHRLDTNSKSDYDLLYIKEVEAASSSDETVVDESAMLIVLVIIGILIFLAIIFCILAYMCIRASKQHHKRRLIQKSYTTPGALPMPEQMVVQPIVEPIIYDNRTFVADETDSHPQSFPIHHVEYAVVQKGQRTIETEQVIIDDTQIVVDVPRDSPVPAQDVFQAREDEEEYRIVTETM